MAYIDRRQLLVGAVASLGAAVVPCAPLLAASRKAHRTLSFYHIHTGKKARFTYWEEGKYNLDVLNEVNWFMRDFRNDTITSMDKHLLDQLTVLNFMAEGRGKFEIISAYRSPETNDMLRATTSGVEEDSLHMRGQAIDVRLQGVSLQNLHKAALKLKSGGVGYYPDSQFLHLDSGKVRSWS